MSRNSSAEGPDVRLTIRGIQTDPEGHTVENTSVYRARYSREKGGHVFRYREGEEGNPVRSELFVSRETVRMERGDSGGSPMLFDPSQELTRCDYGTPFGTIQMEIRTERISVLDGAGTGRSAGETIRIRARVQYLLSMDKAWPLRCSVTIQADPLL